MTSEGANLLLRSAGVPVLCQHFGAGIGREAGGEAELGEERAG